MGDNPVDSGEGATMCETWSINIIIALKATSTEDDLKYDLNQINQFLNNVGLTFISKTTESLQINKYCDERTTISIFAPGYFNKDCETFQVSTNLAKLN